MVYCLIEMRLRQAKMKVSGKRVLENFAELAFIESIFNDGSRAFFRSIETPFQRQVLFIFGYPSLQNFSAGKVPI